MSNINQLVLEELTTGQKVGLGVGAAAATPYVMNQVKTGMAQGAIKSGNLGAAAEHLKSANSWSNIEPHKMVGKLLRGVGSSFSDNK